MPRPKLKNRGGPTIADELPLWEFIYDTICEKEQFEEVGAPLFEAFIEKAQSKFTVEQLSEFYTKLMEPGLYKSELDNEKILALYQALELEISPHMENMLEMRCKAGLRVDSDRVLIHYTFFSPPNPSSSRKAPETPKPKKPEPEKVPEPAPKPALPAGDSTLPSDVTIDADFDRLIWKYLIENFATLTAYKLLSVEFWQEMLDRHKMPIKSPYIVLRHVESHLLKNLWKLQKGTDVVVKMRLLKDLLLPLNGIQRQWLLDNQRVEVKITPHGYVGSWKLIEPEPEPPLPQRNIATWTPRAEKPNGMELMEEQDDYELYVRRGGSSSSRATNARGPSVASHRASQLRAPKIEVDDEDMTMTSSSSFRRTDRRIPFTAADDLHAWRFILQKMYDPRTKKLNGETVQPKGNRFWDEYIRVYKSPKTSTNWASHFRKKMCSTLHEMKLARETKLMLYTHLGIPITQDVLEILESECSAKMKLSRDGRLLSWRFKSGGNRERTIDTEPLVNDDEETDGESIGAAVPNEELKGADEPRDVPSTSSGGQKKRRQSEQEPEEDEIPTVKKRKEKRREEDVQEEEVVGKRKRKQRVEQPEEDNSFELQNVTPEKSSSDPKTPEPRPDTVQLKQEVSLRSFTSPKTPKTPRSAPRAPAPPESPKSPESLKSPAPRRRQSDVVVVTESDSPPPPPAPIEDVDEEKNIEESSEMSQINNGFIENVGADDDDDDIQEIEQEIEQPFDLDGMDGAFMSSYDLLMVMTKAMEEEGDSAHNVVTPALQMAFEKVEQEKCSMESVARHQITEVITSHAHPTHQEHLMGHQLQLIDKTTQFCENPTVFRERMSQIKGNLARKVEKMRLSCALPDE